MFEGLWAIRLGLRGVSALTVQARRLLEALSETLEPLARTWVVTGTLAEFS